MTQGEVLRRHIESSIAMGSSKKEIEDLLIKAGWPRDLVKKYTTKEGTDGSLFKKPSGKSAILLNRITKSFGDKLILENINLDIKEGETFGIIGLSGVGKTTLLNIIVGFVEPDSGDVITKLPNGQTASVLRNPRLVKSHFGFSTQIPSLYSKLTVEENLLHFAALYGIPDTKRNPICRSLLDLVNLFDVRGQLAQTLSLGMKKRLDIACSLIHDPDILILDEPTADMDPVTRKQMWELIKRINKKGKTIVIASHFVGDIESICSRIAIIRNRKITEVGTTEELRSIYSTNYEIEIVTESMQYNYLTDALKSRNDPSATCIKRGRVFAIYTQKPQAMLNIVTRAVESAKDSIIQLKVARPSLSEVFEALIRK